MVDIWPWVALVFGVSQLVAAGVMMRLLRTATAAEQLMSAQPVLSVSERLAMSAGVGVLAVNAAILFMALPGLRRRSHGGWRLLLLGFLLNLGYVTVSFFIPGRGVVPAIMGTVGSVVGLYLLLQVRGYFTSR